MDEFTTTTASTTTAVETVEASFGASEIAFSEQPQTSEKSTADSPVDAEVIRKFASSNYKC
ncbi:hypothetical protein EIP91_006173 [Steccherinum ochraceum]|uniref:Uncharacterized protein n=1 Tax=Steccherinum ochraceum TaxID=92696 RepID=A0A4R0R8N3_9APHY|nr:hypothetical protein EIP91_006173 [Steccherinum ochraceum]